MVNVILSMTGHRTDIAYHNVKFKSLTILELKIQVRKFQFIELRNYKTY